MSDFSIYNEIKFNALRPICAASRVFCESKCQLDYCRIIVTLSYLIVFSVAAFTCYMLYTLISFLWDMLKEPPTAEEIDKITEAHGRWTWMKPWEAYREMVGIMHDDHSDSQISNESAEHSDEDSDTESVVEEAEANTTAEEPTTSEIHDTDTLKEDVKLGAGGDKSEIAEKN